LDPLDVRLKNFAAKDPVWNIPYTSKKLKECYAQGAKAINWQKRNKKAGESNSKIKNGLGMASQIWWGSGGPPAEVILKLNRDSSLEVLCGSQDIGTGTYTILAQVVSEVMEIPISKVNVTLGDTQTTPFAPSSGGSVTAPSISPAARHAAEQMKQKVLEYAATISETNIKNLVYKDGKVLDINDPSKTYAIRDILGKVREKVLTTTGAREANIEGHMIQTFGAQFADVDVDTETGKVKVNKIVAAHDIGRTLNRKLLENQFHGGIIQGLSFALMEERIIDHNTGRVITTNLHDYKIPTVADIPEIEVIIVSDFDPKVSNTGVKGIGEPAIIPTAGAIANAIFNAIGVQIKSLPITPDKILDALY
jgi:xanthine dehydrogenase YagR molybdenum-binding subunit